MQCVVCKKDLIGNQTKYCSKKCCLKESNNKNQNSKIQHERGMGRRLKLILTRGGKCQVCGYNKNYAALAFHHRNPEEKLFNIDLRKCSNSNWESLITEANKCDILCFNCHMEHHWPKCSLKENIYRELYSYKISLPIVNVCFCGKIIDERAKMCETHYRESARKAGRPTKEKLQELIYQMPFTKIGEMYSVSDNSIRKWCKNYGLEIPKFPKGYWISSEQKNNTSHILV